MDDSGSDERGLRQTYPPLQNELQEINLEKAAIVRHLFESEARESTPMSNLRSELRRLLGRLQLCCEIFLCVFEAVSRPA